METATLEKPLPSGRTADGKFVAGNKIANGHARPHARKTMALRNALYSAVSQEDVRQIFRKLIEMAKGGNVPAAREVLDRLFGKPDIKVDLTQHGTVLELVEQIVQVNHVNQAGATQDHLTAPDPGRLLPQ